ncbi:MAG: hypothetical protein RLZ98_1773 [Pseudomonadota bacterium]|jgi:predicted metal-dependent enzyme (double-stranded beta helix superfamily)
MSNRLPRFQTFIDELRAIWSAEPDMEKRYECARPVLEALVRDPLIQESSKSWPCTEGHKNLVLYTDPDHGFVINAVVRLPGRVGRIHDHGDCWVAYGVCDGLEALERYDRLDDGSKPGHAEIRLASDTPGTPGKVDVVAPYEIHREKGGPGRSAAVILRSRGLGKGTIKQGRYDAETFEYFEGWGAEQVDFELVA